MPPDPVESLPQARAIPARAQELFCPHLNKEKVVLPNRDERIKKLKFQSCKRGLLEAELILRPFAQKHLNSLDDAELDAYERLINMEDLDLWEVISGRREVPQGTDPALIGLIRGFLPRSNGYQKK